MPRRKTDRKLTPLQAIVQAYWDATEHWTGMDCPWRFESLSRTGKRLLADGYTPDMVAWAVEQMWSSNRDRWMAANYVPHLASVRRFLLWRVPSPQDWSEDLSVLGHHEQGPLAPQFDLGGVW